jgi:hypothetical protein
VRRPITGRPITGRTVTALAALLVVLLTVPPAAAQEEDDDGDARDRSPRASLALASQTSWVAPSGEFAMRIGTEGVSADDAELRVTVHERLTSRSAFALTAAGRVLGDPVLRMPAVPLTELDRDPAGAVSVRIRLRDADDPFDAERLRLGAAGVYPVRVELRDGDGTLDAFTTHLVRAPGNADRAVPLDVSLVLPVEADLALQPDGEVDLPRRHLDAVGTTIGALERTPDVPLVVDPSPETLDALDADPTGAGGDLLDTLSRSLDDRQVLARPFVPIDVTAFVGAQLEDEAAAQFTRGAEITGDLLDLRPDGRTFIASQPITEAGLDRLREVGIDQVVLREEALEPLVRPLTLTSPFVVETAEGRRLSAASADAALTGHFQAVDPVLGAHHLLADLSVLFFDSPGVAQRGVVVLPPDNWTPSDVFLEVLMEGLSQAPILRPTVLDDLLADVATATDDDGELLVRDLVPGEASSLDRVAGAMQLVRLRLLGYRSMLPSDEDVYGVLEKRLLAAQAEGISANRRAAYLQGVNRAIDDDIGLIEAPGRQAVTLTAREGEIPLTFRNATGRPVVVTVQLQSDKLEFPEGATRTLTLADRSTTLRFEVRARTSGAFPLRVSVASPACCLELTRTRFTVRSTAVSGVGVFLSIGAAAFLLVWWLSHFRSVRRSRRLVGT